MHYVRIWNTCVRTSTPCSRLGFMPVFSLSTLVTSFTFGEKPAVHYPCIVIWSLLVYDQHPDMGFALSLAWILTLLGHDCLLCAVPMPGCTGQPALASFPLQAAPHGSP